MLRLIVICSFFVLVLSLSSCGNSDNCNCENVNNEDTYDLPEFIIFQTESTHSGNFLDDPVLSGNTAIEKADDFCNCDSNKPDDGIYKALIVDDNNRTAIPAKDWVLQPNTTYYRPDASVLGASLEDTEDPFTIVGTTTPEAIFNVAFQELDNSISSGQWNHTGIYDVNDFSSNGYNCESWSSNTSALNTQGLSSAKDGDAFNLSMDWSGYTFTCSDLRSIYCVKQPESE